MKRYAALVLVALALAGCQTVQNLEGVFNTITTTTVPPAYVNVALNTYYALKQTATNYAQYCIAQKFPKPTCSAANRRAVIRFVKSGDGAVAALAPGLNGAAPLTSTAYNTLVGAINGLQSTPVNSVAKGS
jgi:hypothetical protein